MEINLLLKVFKFLLNMILKVECPSLKEFLYKDS